MALKDITITGSINSYPTLSYGQKTYIASTDEQSFPIEHITGSAGGATPDFNGQVATTNLFVNITQSWSGSNDTPLGLVNFIHDTEEEFINGEYSGSALQVADQRLIDEDCIQYLYPSTVAINYTPYFYVTPTFPPLTTNNNNDPNFITAQTYLNNFLNSNTSPNSGEIYILNKVGQNISPIPPFTTTTTRTIDFIKISKFDLQGNDNTISLQGLDSLRIYFTDPNLPQYADFAITNISEFSFYFLYQLSPISQLEGIGANTLLLSTNNNTLNYTLEVNRPSSIFAGSGEVAINGFNLVNNLSPNIIDLPTGILSSTNTSPIYIQCTASFTTIANPFSAGVEGFFALKDSNGNFLITGSLINSINPTTNVFSGSFQLVENTNYRITVTGAGVTSYLIQNATWIITQSVNPQGPSSSSIILEPYLYGNFEYSDCNVLINNATEPEYNSDFFKVNYGFGQLIPTNQEEIINGTAEIAPVNPSNYTTRAQIYPRYNGVKSNAPDFNKPSNDGTGYGGLAVAGNPSPYIGYYTSKGGSTPEVLEKTIINLDYIIDEDANAQIPALSDFTIDSQKSLYPRDGYLYLDPDKNSTNQQFAGNNKYKIYRSGEYATPIVYSQTGSNPGFISPLIFNPPGVPQINQEISGKYVKSRGISKVGLKNSLFSRPFSSTLPNASLQYGYNSFQSEGDPGYQQTEQYLEVIPGPVGNNGAPNPMFNDLLLQQPTNKVYPHTWNQIPFSSLDTVYEDGVALNNSTPSQNRGFFQIPSLSDNIGFKVVFRATFKWDPQPVNNIYGVGPSSIDPQLGPFSSNGMFDSNFYNNPSSINWGINTGQGSPLPANLILNPTSQTLTAKFRILGTDSGGWNFPVLETSDTVIFQPGETKTITVETNLTHQFQGGYIFVQGLAQIGNFDYLQQSVMYDIPLTYRNELAAENNSGLPASDFTQENLLARVLNNRISWYSNSLTTVGNPNLEIIQTPPATTTEIDYTDGDYILQVVDSQDSLTPEGNSSLSYIQFTSSFTQALGLIYPQVSGSGYDSTIYPFNFPENYEVDVVTYFTWNNGASGFAFIPPPSGTFDYEIRFNADENQAYPIVGYYYDDTTSNFILIILRPRTAILTSDTTTPTPGPVPIENYQSFLIRRWIPRAGYIYLDVDAPLGRGVVKSEYITNNISTQIPQIIKELTDKGLIIQNP